MKALRIFISYSHDDEPIATALSNLLQQGLGPALAEIFLDKQSISFGDGIKDKIIASLDNADVLIAVVTGGLPASTLSWPGFEIGRFTATWDAMNGEGGPHGGRKRSGGVGQVYTLINGATPLGPLTGTRPINLGISEQHLSGPESEEATLAFRGVAIANNEVLRFISSLETLVKNEPEYGEFFSTRVSGLSDLVIEFKLRAFVELKRRIRYVSKPSKQLIVRCSEAANITVGLPAGAIIASYGGASEVFGRREDDPSLFKKTVEPKQGPGRYETSWGQFKASVCDHKYGAYWCGVIELAVIGARSAGAKLDPNLVIISDNDRRFRIVATTVTTYFNNDSEISLYLIEPLQRRDHGEMETSSLLNYLNLVSRFRFAFLEAKSPFSYLNFMPLTAAKAKDMLTELDYLKSEATCAGLDMPGAWQRYLSLEQLCEMMRVWNEVDFELRKICNTIIGQRSGAPVTANLTEGMNAQLKRINDDVRPFNTLLGAGVTKDLLNIFK